MKELKVAAASENMLYSGVVKSNDLYNTSTGTFNRKKRKMRLVAVAPKFNDSVVENQSIQNLDSSSSQLSKKFGSKTVKRKIEQRERMKTDIGTVKDELERTVADIKVGRNETNALIADENDTDYKPNINRAAEVVEDVYNINDIVAEDVLNSISEEVKRILEDENSTFNTTAFVTTKIEKLKDSSVAEKKTRLQLLLYIDCLIKFLLKPSKDVSSRCVVVCPYSKLVQDDILKRYTVRSGRSRLRPNSMRDKCVCSILVLSMVACNYKLNLDVIVKEVKLGLKKVQDLSRVLAFYVKKEEAMLSLPLPSTVNRFVGKRKKK